MPENASKIFGSSPRIFEDYRRLLDRKDVDVITIGAPNHWHAKMLITPRQSSAGTGMYANVS